MSIFEFWTCSSAGVAGSFGNSIATRRLMDGNRLVDELFFSSAYAVLRQPWHRMHCIACGASDKMTSNIDVKSDHLSAQIADLTVKLAQMLSPLTGVFGLIVSALLMSLTAASNCAVSTWARARPT